MMKAISVFQQKSEKTLQFLYLSKLKSSTFFNKKMAPTGFEPATPGLKVQYSNRAELRGLDIK